MGEQNNSGQMKAMAKQPRAMCKAILSGLAMVSGRGAILGAACLFAGVISVTKAEAQSRYACTQLDNAHVPVIEGENGNFFRVDPDLVLSHDFSEAVIERIGGLSDILAARGTKLVVVPLPTKAIAMPDLLGPDASIYAYDRSLAATLYQDIVVRFRKAGVTTVDMRRELIGRWEDTQAFFKTDPRMTNEGLIRLVAAVSKQIPSQGPAAENGFTTVLRGQRDIQSHDHLVLQMSCLSALPGLETGDFITTVSDVSLLAGDAPKIVYAGTNVAAHPDLNLAGFLSDAFDKAAFVINGGDRSLDALTSYLTSDAFQEAVPEVLIWELPIWEPLASGGDQPLREVLAAAEGQCETPLEMALLETGGVRVDLSGTEFTANDTVYLNNANMPSQTALFSFVASNGESRVRSVTRSESVQTSGRFYMPLSGLWETGAEYIDIDVPLDEAALPTVTLCRKAPS